ncbi:MAG: CinA family nicotinamide mononucleotide deamidase-related protein [Smithellaceae bacterium]|nr:CinA family nicotinamide mononucleotide deamidase-related protein [Smithellaceae bacterium]
MKLGILTIGNELTSGRTQDANSSLISREMTAQGWQVTVMMSVGDREEAIKDALNFILAKADAIVVTGGLGPTADDITTVCIARAFSLELAPDEQALLHIKGLFEKFRLKWTDNNAKQAIFPAGAEPLRNPVGTAWGFSLRVGEKMIIVIPGVPAEVKRMLPEGVIPLLRTSFPQEAPCIETYTFKLFGLAEALIDSALTDVDFDSLGVAVGFYPNFPENHLVLTARGTSAEETRERIRQAGAEVENRLARHIFARGEETIEGSVASQLTEKGLTIALGESCTGGLIADRLTNIPGSSSFFDRAVIVYSNRSKTEMLGVPEEIIRKFGAVSPETARLMAEGARQAGGTDLGLAVTGIAGPAGGTEEKPVGTAFIALADRAGTVTRSFAFRWDRRRNKIIASQAALMLLNEYLKGETHHDE